MSGWLGWLIPILAVLLIGVGTTFYLKRVREPRDETAAGIAALAGMRWRDFIHLVLDALNRRGYERVFDTSSGSDESGYLLEREGQHWLLSSKHGTAYVLGSTAIAEFSKEIRMRGAAGGILVTPGQFAPEALPLARAQRIELLDGVTLWPELRPLLPEAQRNVITAPTRAQTRSQILIAWGIALAVGLLLFGLADHGRIDADATAVSTGAGTSPSPAAGIASAPALPPRSIVPTDPAALESRRKDVSVAISTLPGIDRALWSTQSTLLVYLSDDLTDPLPEICPLIERYDELAASRIQLQPPVGSARPVRFVQCKAY